MMILVVVGGLLYTGGAVVYAMKRPNPWPGHFGFHEIFHVCTVLAFLCHWTACLLIALAPAYSPLGCRRCIPARSADAAVSPRAVVRVAGVDVLVVDLGRLDGAAAACCSASSSSLMSARTRPRRMRRIMSHTRTTTASATKAITTKPHGPGRDQRRGRPVGVGRRRRARRRCARGGERSRAWVSSFRARSA